MAAQLAGTAAPTAEALAAGRLLFAQECAFLAGASEAAHLPAHTLPEVAFAGRSNVGKSSLLNALTGRTALARTSRTPGRTRQINFFDLGGRLVLADLPGYGYARASRTEARRWGELTKRYLRERPQLRRVCLLIDARGGARASDHAVMAEMDEAAVTYQLIFTKADKVTPAALNALIGGMVPALAKHAAAHPDCLATSAASDLGIAELRAVLAMLAAPAKHR